MTSISGTKIGTKSDRQNSIDLSLLIRKRTDSKITATYFKVELQLNVRLNMLKLSNFMVCHELIKSPPGLTNANEVYSCL